MDPVAALFLILIVPLVVLAVLGLLARREHAVVITGVPLEEVGNVVYRSAKGMMWASEDGPGDLNFRRRTPIKIRGTTGPTLSVQFHDREDGSVEIRLWMSAWSSVWGIASGGESIMFRRWKVSRAVRRCEAAAMQGGTPSHLLPGD